MYIRRKCYSSLYDYDYNDYLYEKTFSDYYDYDYYYAQKIFADITAIHRAEADARAGAVDVGEKYLSSLEQRLEIAKGKEKKKILDEIEAVKSSLPAARKAAAKANKKAEELESLAEQMANGRERAERKKAAYEARETRRNEKAKEEYANKLREIEGKKASGASVRAERAANRNFIDPTTLSMKDRMKNYRAKKAADAEEAFNQRLADALSEQKGKNAEYVNRMRSNIIGEYKGQLEKQAGEYKGQLEKQAGEYGSKIADLNKTVEDITSQKTKAVAERDAEAAARKAAEENFAKYKGEAEKGILGWARKNKKLAGLAAAGSGLGLLGAGAGINHAIASRNRR